MKKVLLYSGGLDSWLIDKLWKPDVKVFVNVDSIGSHTEVERLPKDVQVHNLDIGKFELVDKNYLLPLRNLFLVEIASYYGDVICLGATGSSTHYDKTEKFAKYAEDVLNYLWSESNPEKRVKIVMPFRTWSKVDMLKEFVRQGGSLKEAWESSFSCYNPVNGKPCMECTSCKKRIAAFKEAGYDFSD